MINERDLWTCALLLLDEYGVDAATIIAERLHDLAIADDRFGVALWQKIESHVADLEVQRTKTQ